MTGHNHILFSAGGLSLAADSAFVHCIHDGLTTQPERGTADWFLGLAVADERLLPVTDLGVYLNGNECLGRIVEVAKSLGIAGLKIDEVHGVSRHRPEPMNSDDADMDTELPLKPLAINDLGQQYQVVDLASLLQSSRFLNVQLESA